MTFHNWLFRCPQSCSQISQYKCIYLMLDRLSTIFKINFDIEMKQDLNGVLKCIWVDIFVIITFTLNFWVLLVKVLHVYYKFERLHLTIQRTRVSKQSSSATCAARHTGQLGGQKGRHYLTRSHLGVIKASWWELRFLTLACYYKNHTFNHFLKKGEKPKEKPIL